MVTFTIVDSSIENQHIIIMQIVKKVLKAQTKARQPSQQVQLTKSRYLDIITDIFYFLMQLPTLFLIFVFNSSFQFNIELKQKKRFQLNCDQYGQYV